MVKSEITFVSACYGPSITTDSLIKGLMISNQKYKNYDIHFYGKNDSSGFVSLYKSKIYDLLNLLENDTYITNLVCFMDSFDTLINRELDNNFIEEFENYNCKVLFGAETNSFPFKELGCITDLHTYEFKYLNSGLFIGYKDYLIEILKECIKYKKIINCLNYTNNDQTLFSLIYMYHVLSFDKSIQIDYNCNIFLNIFGKKINDFVINQNNDDKYLTFKNKRPYIIHANGSSKFSMYPKLIKNIFY